MSRILKVDGFSDSKREELYKRCSELYPSKSIFIKNFLNSVEDFFKGYWNVQWKFFKRGHSKLRKLEYSENVDDEAWILLPGDMGELLERLILSPGSCIQLKEGVMGVPIHYRGKRGGVSQVYWVEGGRFFRDKFYLTSRQSRDEFLVNPPPAFSKFYNK
jgi:hypothetical protein|tara:strand:- start:24576 stop:25055 length:480 start_codon:yes stop_codon:yes gene_type:complete